MFRNYLTGKDEADAVEQKGFGWFIKSGFAGNNSPTNNRFGYKSKEAAEAAIRRYQGRSIR